MKTLLLLPASLIAAAATAALPFTRNTDQPTARAVGEHDWVVDPVHSAVVFRVRHADAAWFFGTFDEIAGEVTLDPENPADGSVALTIPVASVDTNNEKRDTHLKSPDFFSAKENPEITFRSSSIERKGEELMVTGDLSMAGKTKSVTLPVRHVGDGEFYGARRGYVTEFTVKRTDFGMTYGIDKNVLGDEVTLTIGLELTKPAK